MWAFLSLLLCVVCRSVLQEQGLLLVASLLPNRTLRHALDDIPVRHTTQFETMLGWLVCVCLLVCLFGVHHGSPSGRRGLSTFSLAHLPPSLSLCLMRCVCNIGWVAVAGSGHGPGQPPPALPAQPQPGQRHGVNQRGGARAPSTARTADPRTGTALGDRVEQGYNICICIM
jgi:hypothetical protein